VRGFILFYFILFYLGVGEGLIKVKPFKLWRIKVSSWDRKLGN